MEMDERLDSGALCSAQVISSNEKTGAERCVSNPQISGRKEVKPQAKDRMTELINLQKSSGAFDVSREDWAGSVLEDFLGDYEEVKSICPSEIAIHLWITALSMKILEIKMGDEKELWDLVVRKSLKFLDVEMKKTEKDSQDVLRQKMSLIEEAEKFIKSK